MLVSVGLNHLLVEIEALVERAEILGACSGALKANEVIRRRYRLVPISPTPMHVRGGGKDLPIVGPSGAKLIDDLLTFVLPAKSLKNLSSE